MPGDYSCFLCSKTIFHSAKKKHLFSKRHLSEIQNGILRARGVIELWIAKYEKGEKNPERDFLPPISLSGKGKYHIVCIPCKHIGETIKGHTCNQEAMKQNVCYFKNVLKHPEPQGPPKAPEPQGPPLVPQANPEEIAKLKKEIEQLEQDNQDLLEASNQTDDRCKKSETIYKALTYVLEFVKQDNYETYETIIDNLKEDYSSIIHYLKN